MAYDSKTFGDSPFGQPIAAARSPSSKAADNPEALSDHVGELAREPARKPGSEQPSARAEDPPKTEPNGQPLEPAPALPTSYRLLAKPSDRKAALFYIPKGRIANLTMLGEALIWLMAWGTVGFFRAHVPAPVVAFFDALFSPWGMAGLTLAIALLLGRLFRHYRLKLARIRELAVLAIGYGEAENQAEAQVKIDRLLAEAEERTKRAGRWLVTWLTALGCLFIIGAFY